jgi:ATP-dependent RNA helicase DDX55/SPB4
MRTTQLHFYQSANTLYFRELAAQIYLVLLSLLAFHPPSANVLKPRGDFESIDSEMPDISHANDSSPKIIPQLLLGDSKSSPSEDLRTFLNQGTNLLVATPGRLAAMLSSPYVHCPQSSFEILVLDEADRLLDLGFKEDLQRILNRLPKQRRTGLFSASVTEAVDQIVRVGLRNPVKIAVKVKGSSGVEDKRTPASLKMTYVVTPPTHKFPVLERLLTSVGSNPAKSIVYFATCAQVDYFQHLLRPVLPQTLALVPLHGKYPPKVREKNFKLFTNSLMPSVLLTTDVAARGLDIPSVDLVVQVDPPSDPKAFIHRCGRAGRAGRKGLSVVLLHPGKEEDYVRFLSVRQTPVASLEHPSLDVRPEVINNFAESFVRTVSQDRDLHDKGQRAFVSWVKSYSKHQARSIFSTNDFDWYDLGQAWGLLRLPRMPELKGYDGDTSLGRDIDLDQIPYADKSREKRRLQEMQEVKENDSNDDRHKKPPSKESKAWSKNLELKQDREKRRGKRAWKKEKERIERMTEGERDRERETEKMILQVQRQNELKGVDGGIGDEFTGFDD